MEDQYPLHDNHIRSIDLKCPEKVQKKVKKYPSLIMVIKTLGYSQKPKD